MRCVRPVPTPVLVRNGRWTDCDRHLCEGADAVLVVTDLGLPDPGRAAAVAGAGGDLGMALGDRAEEVDADRLSHRGVPSPRTASAVVREQRSSITVDMTPPSRIPKG